MPRPRFASSTLASLLILLLGSVASLAAQTAATKPDRLALGGPPPVVQTQAQLVRFPFMQLRAE